MNSPFAPHSLEAQTQPQIQSRARPQASHSHSNLSMQSGHHREPGESNGFRHHNHHNSRPGHDDLSSLVMSAVDVAGLHTPDLREFTEIFKSSRATPRSIIPASHSDFNVSPTPLLVNEPSQLLPRDRSGISPRFLGNGGLPQKRLAENPEPLHPEPGRFTSSLLTGVTGSSVGNIGTLVHSSQDLQSSSVWDNELTGSSSVPLSGDSVGVIALEEREPTHPGRKGDQEEQTEHPGSGSSVPTTKLVENPPDLAKWRQKLFDLEDRVVLTQEEYETYFPWVDNVYSHRSTQRYKRKPFVTHYWDCRLKGRPPGTAKSDDPNKRKRQRRARERDQCDVKIKITEYLAGATLEQPQSDGNDVSPTVGADGSSLGDLMARMQGKPFWTIQRINGTGANGVSGDGKLEVHRHTLAKSDEVKKNSVQRWIAAREKDAKKSMKHKSMKPSKWKATGDAALTVKRHALEGDLKFYAACFCPFSQRVWIALEAKGLEYQYCEIDPFRTPKPTHLLEANPRGLVPAIRQGDWACGESSVILEYLEEIDSKVLLFPTNPRLKANCRFWIDFINTRVVPTFHGLLAASDDKLTHARETLRVALSLIVQAADEIGPYFLGRDMCLVDIHLAPFALRLARLPERFGTGRDWAVVKEREKEQDRWKKWLRALEDNPHVRNTTSEDTLYKESVDVLIRECRDHLE